MPGPAPWPLLGTLPYYWSGHYSWDRLHTTGLTKYREFGDCVRETILPGVCVVWLFQPRDIRAMFKAEGRDPSRRSHTALAHLRLSQPQYYNCPGLLPTNGSDWRRIRKPLQKPLLGTLTANRQLPALDQVMLEAVEFLGKNKEYLATRDLLPELEKCFMESTGQVALGRRLDCLHLHLPSSSTAARLIRAAEQTNSSVLGTDNGLPVWRLMETTEYRKTREGMEVISEVARERVSERMDELAEGEEREEGALLDQWLGLGELDFKDVATALEDFLLAGVHTSSYTAAFLLHHLSQSPTVQYQLAREARRVLGRAGPSLTRRDLSAVPYTRAVLWESLRLNPVAVGTGRILASDATLGGYRVPKGTVCVAMNQVSSRLEEFFPEPGSFLPERWLPGSQYYQLSVDPFLVLPFGHGPRACIGRRFAEDALIIFLLRLCSEYRLQWKGGRLDCMSQLINKPDSEVMIQMTRWREGELDLDLADELGEGESVYNKSNIPWGPL